MWVRAVAQALYFLSFDISIPKRNDYHKGLILYEYFVHKEYFTFYKNILILRQTLIIMKYSYQYSGTHVI